MLFSFALLLAYWVCLSYYIPSRGPFRKHSNKSSHSCCSIAFRKSPQPKQAFLSVLSAVETNEVDGGRIRLPSTCWILGNRSFRFVVKLYSVNPVVPLFNEMKKEERIV